MVASKNEHSHTFACRLIKAKDISRSAPMFAPAPNANIVNKHRLILLYNQDNYS